MIEFELHYAASLRLKTPKSGPRAAKSALLPMPSTIKMAVIAAALKMNRREDAQTLFDLLVERRVGYDIPKTIGVTNGFKRTLSYDRDNHGVLESYGFSETAIYEDNLLRVSFDVSSEHLELIKYYLELVRWVGDSSSLVTIMNVKDSSKENFEFPYNSIADIIEAGITPEDKALIYMVDFSPKKDLCDYLRGNPKTPVKLYEKRILCVDYEKIWLPGRNYILKRG